MRRLAAAALLAACTPKAPPTPPAEPAEEPIPAEELTDDAQGRSLLGKPLIPPELEPEVRSEREQQLREARAAYDQNPKDPEAIIWLGRRTAYLGQYMAAIAIYTDGIRKHPSDARMYRHRGHRFVTLRRFDQAIADLGRAARLIEGTEDQVEPDGQPNDRNIPTSTLHFNIYYHLGLAHYLRGDLEAAKTAYESCLEVSKNPDALVATTHWFYMTLRRLGDDDAAEALLEPITEDLDVIENHGYKKLTLLYKGELDAKALAEELAESEAIDQATVGYGLANWHASHGRWEEANALLKQVLKTPQWAAFGHIAAEADIARSTRRPKKTK